MQEEKERAAEIEKVRLCQPAASAVSSSFFPPQEMRRRKRFLDSEVKLLLLGAGESGKSTIAKQMKIIHLRGFTEAERLAMREVIFSNIVLAIKTLCQAMDRLGLEVEQKENEPRRAALAEAPNQVTAIPNAMRDDIAALWADKGVQLCFKSRHLFQLSDSSDYYFDALARITDPSYVPTESDILRARVKTTGIQEITFTTNDVNFRMVDVGGQRSERKKWIHCFQDVTAVIFCVAMSEYDLKLYEDETVGRTEESLKLFDEICNSKVREEEEQKIRRKTKKRRE